MENLEIIRDSLKEVMVVGRSTDQDTDQDSDQVTDQDMSPVERLLSVLNHDTLHRRQNGFTKIVLYQS